MSKYALIPGLMLAVGTSSASADTILGAYIGIEGWDVSPTGKFGSRKDNQQTFDFGDETPASFYVAIEHLLPMIPNVRVTYQDLDYTGKTTLTNTFIFGGTTYAVNSNLLSETNIGGFDTDLYYELFDNDLISLDLGMSVKYVDGDITVKNVDSPAQQSKETFDGFLPMLYARAEFGIPGTGLSIFGEGNYITISDNTASDYTLALAYEFVDTPAVDITGYLGYRRFNLDLEDIDKVVVNINMDGLYGGVVFHF